MLARRLRDSHCCEALLLPPAPRGLAGTISGRPRQRRPRPSSRNRPRGFQTLSPVGGGRLGVAVVGLSLTAGWALTGRAYRAGSPSRASLHRLPASAGRRLWFPSAAGASAAAPGRPRPLPFAPPRRSRPPPLLRPAPPCLARARLRAPELRLPCGKWRAASSGSDARRVQARTGGGGLDKMAGSTGLWGGLGGPGAGAGKWGVGLALGRRPHRSRRGLPSRGGGRAASDGSGEEVCADRGEKGSYRGAGPGYAPGTILPVCRAATPLWEPGLRGGWVVGERAPVSVMNVVGCWRREDFICWETRMDRCYSNGLLSPSNG